MSMIDLRRTPAEKRKVCVNVTLSKRSLARADAAAALLGLKRSTYIDHLIRAVLGTEAEKAHELARLAHRMTTEAMTEIARVDVERFQSAWEQLCSMQPNDQEGPTKAGCGSLI